MIRYVLVAAFVLRLVAAGWWQNKADQEDVLFRFGDSQSYWSIASNIACVGSFEYGGPDSRVFRTPLYPMLLAPLTRLEPRTGVIAARLVGVLLGTLSVGLVVLAAQSLAGKKAALFAGLLAAVYPGAIGLSVFILSEALFCPLLLLSLFGWLKRLDTGSSVWWAVLSGATSGLACLTRPSWILWPAWLFVFTECLLAFSRILGKPRSKPVTSSGVRAEFGHWAVFLLSMMVVMSPWWLRNYFVTGHFVPTTLQVGASLYDGLHPGASGSSDEGMAFTQPFEVRLRAEYANSLHSSADLDRFPDRSPVSTGSFEWELNRRLYQAAVKWAFENRSDVCRLALVKFGKMWTPWPTAKEIGGIGVRIAESTVYVAVVVCAALAFWAVPMQRMPMWLFVLPTFYFAALHTVFASSVRYRQPAILVLCVVAGIGAAWMLDRIEPKRQLSKIGKL